MIGTSLCKLISGNCMAEAYDYRVKVVMIGDSGVGKTSIMTRYCESLFSESPGTTVYTDFIPKDVTIDGKVLRAQIWDTAGQERYRLITRAYYREAAAVLLVYDITNHKSFDNITAWIEELRRVISLENAEVVLLGNKTDREEQREVATEEGEAIAGFHEFTFLETSAKTASNIDSAFYLLLSQLYRKHIRPTEPKSLELPPGVKPRLSSSTIFLSRKHETKAACCLKR